MAMRTTKTLEQILEGVESEIEGRPRRDPEEYVLPDNSIDIDILFSEDGENPKSLKDTDPEMYEKMSGVVNAMLSAAKESAPMVKAAYVKDALKLITKNDDELKNVIASLAESKRKERFGRKIRVPKDQFFGGQKRAEEEEDYDGEES
jgi:hypothetical protein